ncbi:MAG: tetratricopeptide repeat protein [Deltaproteobacteria bacterium]|nr:MAG: tetratricopeptide repeat protein [Deltaproteobacteria bacterium]
MTDPAELFNAALTAIEAGDEATASDRLRQVIARNPADTEAVALLCELYLDHERPEAAEEVLKTVAAAVPGEPTYLVRRAELRLAAGDPRGAAVLLTAALKLQPGHWEALYLLGDAFCDVAAFPEAARAYRLSLESNPFSHEAWYNLGVALAEAGDDDGAAEAWEAYLRVRRDAPDRAEVEAEITRLRAASGGAPG